MTEITYEMVPSYDLIIVSNHCRTADVGNCIVLFVTKQECVLENNGEIFNKNTDHTVNNPGSSRAAGLF